MPRNTTSTRMTISGAAREKAVKNANLAFTDEMLADIASIRSEAEKAGLRTPSLTIVIALALKEAVAPISSKSAGDLVLAFRPYVAGGSLFSAN